MLILFLKQLLHGKKMEYLYSIIMKSILEIYYFFNIYFLNIIYICYRFITKVPGVLYIKNVNEYDSGEYRYVIKY